MSRWSRKTDAEKAEVKRKLEEQHSNSREGQREAHFMQDDEAAHKILSDMELPLRCPKCAKWSGSDTYSVEDRSTMFGKHRMVVGKSRCCNAESMLILQPAMTLHLAHLTLKGRLKGSAPVVTPSDYRSVFKRELDQIEEKFGQDGIKGALEGIDDAAEWGGTTEHFVDVKAPVNKSKEYILGWAAGSALVFRSRGMLI